jgi:hypothetical protein
MQYLLKTQYFFCRNRKTHLEAGGVAQVVVHWPSKSSEIHMESQRTLTSQNTTEKTKLEVSHFLISKLTAIKKKSNQNSMILA